MPLFSLKLSWHVDHPSWPFLALFFSLCHILCHISSSESLSLINCRTIKVQSLALPSYINKDQRQHPGSAPAWCLCPMSPFPSLEHLSASTFQFSGAQLSPVRWCLMQKECAIEADHTQGSGLCCSGWVVGTRPSFSELPAEWLLGFHRMPRKAWA